MKSASIAGNKLNSLSLWILTLLRIAIGWHFLYEGIVKLTTSGWTSASYLLESRWMFSGFFHWIGFKTLAAGAIQPEVGFPYAFKGGADFICVGMYDFQVVEDVNLVLDVLSDESLKNERRRPWRA